MANWDWEKGQDNQIGTEVFSQIALGQLSIYLPNSEAEPAPHTICKS